MKEKNLKVRSSLKRKYSSYAGEISPAAPNLLMRNVKAEKPNNKWLTDILEFRIPAGKVYLSPIIDCFDGAVVSWSISKRPTEELVNSMLGQALKTVDDTAGLIIVGLAGLKGYKNTVLLNLCQKKDVLPARDFLVD